MPSRYHVMSVAKAFQLLEAFSGDVRQMGLPELARLSGQNKATARRLALTLCDLGYLQVGPGKSYILTPKVLDLGSRFLQALSLPEAAEPVLLGLAQSVGESVNLAIRDGRDVVYVLRIPAQERILGVNLHVGSRLPLHATSLGKALLLDADRDDLLAILGEPPWPRYTPTTLADLDALVGDLEASRRRGFAVSDGELEVGLRSIAAPVRGADGRIRASVNVSTHSLRVPEEMLFGPMRETLVEAAGHISGMVGGQGRFVPSHHPTEKWGQRA